MLYGGKALNKGPNIRDIVLFLALLVVCWLTQQLKFTSKMKPLDELVSQRATEHYD